MSKLRCRVKYEGPCSGVTSRRTTANTTTSPPAASAIGRANTDSATGRRMTVALSAKTDYYALEATTKIEDMVEDELCQDTLRSLKYDDLDYLRIVAEDTRTHGLLLEHGDYHPSSDEELGWLGHFIKKSSNLEFLGMHGKDIRDDIFSNCSKQSIDKCFEDIGKCNNIKRMEFERANLAPIFSKLVPAIKNKCITRWAVEECNMGVAEVNMLFNAFRDMKHLQDLCISYRHWDDDSNHSCSRYDDAADDVMCRCIISLVACTSIWNLTLKWLNLSDNSCAALSFVFPRMAALSNWTSVEIQSTTAV